MGRIFLVELEGRAYSCKFCKTNLALMDDLISQIVGWKYEAACEKSQKYKEGKFVLERGRIADGSGTGFCINTHPWSDVEDD